MKKILILIVLAIITLFISSNNEYVEIPYSSIRMRVIANSNTTEDQNDKMIVKDKLEETIYYLIDNKTSYNEVVDNIYKNEELIKKSIDDVLNVNGINSDYTYNFGLNYFPEKKYKGLTYSGGNYQSIVVKLGEGGGENFWCVLFPPICLIDENVSDYEYHFLIKDIVNKYN